MYIYIFIITILTPSAVWSYSSGAPKDACSDLLPQHHVPAQKSRPPYTLSVSKFDVRTGDSVKLTLKGNSASDTFKGFLVQARFGDRPVGRFSPGLNSQTLDCSGPQDSITHKKIQEKGEKEVTFDWKPPSDLKGPVTFTATVAKDGGTFWVAKVTQGVNIV